jgi:hypothetical protein
MQQLGPNFVFKIKVLNFSHFFLNSGHYKPTPLKRNLILEIQTILRRSLEILPSILLLVPK